MIAYSQGPVEVLSPMRRRSSTIESTGLDYRTALKVEANISSRIALLLSRQTQDLESVTNQGFDFGSAKSVAKAAHSSIGSPDFLIKASYLPARSMSIHITRSPSDATQPVKRSTLRTTSSADDIKDTKRILGQVTAQAAIKAVDDILTHESSREHDLLNSSPPLKHEIQGTSIPSQTSRKSSRDFIEKKGFRFPRLVLQDKAPSSGTRLPKITLKTMKVNGPRFEVMPVQTSIGSTVLDDSPSQAEAAPESTNLSNMEGVEKYLRPSVSHVPGSYRSEFVTESLEIDTGSVVTGEDVLGFKPSPAGIDGRRNSSRQQSIFTEDLPESQNIANLTEQSHHLNISYPARVNSPSLMSTASKSSAYRHALLKSSIPSSQPVDLGLPVPPVLCAATTPASHGSHEEHNEKGIVYHEAHPAIDALSRFRIIAAQTPLPEDIGGIELSRKPITSPLIIPDPVEHSAPVTQISKNRHKSSAAQANKGPYWDFVPGVEQSVHDVVQEAVRKAVHDAIAPHRVESSRASAAYRKLVADALAEAANITDQYLRRVSVWSASPEDLKRRVSEVNTSSFDDVSLRSNNASPSVGQVAAMEYILRNSGNISQEDISPTSPATGHAASGQYSPSQYSLNPFSRTSIGVNGGSMFNLPATLGSYEKLVEQDRDVDSDNHASLQHEDHKARFPDSSTSKAGPSWISPFKNSQATGAYAPVSTRRSSLKRGHKEPTSSCAPTVERPRVEQSGQIEYGPSNNHLGRGRSNSSSIDSGISRPSVFANAIPALSQMLPQPLRPNLTTETTKSSVGRRSVHWLRELLSNEEAYAPRLTALPPRTRKGWSSSDDRVRSGSAPEIPVKRLYLGATPALDQNNASETFARTITELEHLLNDAILIAHEAAERDDEHFVPKMLGSSTAVFESGRVGVSDESVDSTPERQKVPSWRTDVAVRRHPTQRPTSIESMHESAYTESTFYSSSSLFSGEETVEFLDHEPSRYEKKTVSRTVHNSVDIYQSQVSGHGKRTERGLSPYPQELIIQPGEPDATEELKGPDNVALRSKSSDEDPNISGNYFGMPVYLKALSPMASVTESSPRKHLAKDPAFIPLPVDDKYYKPTIERNQRRSTMSQKSRINLRACRSSISLANPTRLPYEEDLGLVVKPKKDPKALPNKREVREYIRVFHEPPIHMRQSSLRLKEMVRGKSLGEPSSVQRLAENQNVQISEPATSSAIDFAPVTQRDQDSLTLYSHHSLDGPPETVVDFGTPIGMRNLTANPSTAVETSRSGRAVESQDSEALRGDSQLPKRHLSGRRLHRPHIIPSLRGRSHVSLKEHHGFSLTRSHKRQPVARDWSTFRKRWVASVACISTAMIGIIIGIYAGMVPSIQYYIVDFHHYAILGNVFFFVGLAISTMLFWPLPLLHGRKPYILAAMTIAMPLLFPQAVAISSIRSPYVRYWRVGLLLPRALMGFSLGFANMNFNSILTDLFGASLQSGNPHQEVVDEFDVRRHGGGLGLWLGIWTWCFIGSIGIGFLVGAVIINTLAPSWGIYISIIIIAAILLLNILAPETRRSAYRRSIAEVQTKDNEVSRRIARGEVMMHRKGTGPKWWGEEFHQGVVLSVNMLRQPGLLIMSLYIAWIYGQVVLIIVLLGSLTSKYYRFKSPYVGACVSSVPIGALLAVPFQKASLFSRARHHPQRTDSMTFEKRVTWSSHLIRRSIFTLVLPFAGLAYTLSSGGPGTPFILPVIFAALIGFLSNLAIAECHGIIMEAFDTSDLQPGMTGRPRGSSGDRTSNKRTNYSSFPRVSSAFAITQGFGFLIAAAATGVGGVAQRHLGQKLATGVMAAILLVLTILLLCVLIRWKDVQIIPNSKKGEVEAWERARRESAVRRSITGLGEEEPWRPVIIGNPSGKTRRMSILELGSLSRWSEIRRKNKLIDEKGLEGRHPNLAMLGSVGGRVREQINRSPLGSLRRVPQTDPHRGVELSDLPVGGTATGTSWTAGMAPRAPIVRETKAQQKSRLSKRYEFEDDKSETAG